MWSGSIAAIPSGFALCDGNNGTPDLLDRFILSVPNSGTNPGTTGGAHTYSLNTSQLPAHDHTGSGNTNLDGAHSHTIPNGFLLQINAAGSIAWYNWSNPTKAINVPNTATDGAHQHAFSFTTSQTGSGAAIDNKPLYYSLAFIMKL